MLFAKLFKHATAVAATAPIFFAISWLPTAWGETVNLGRCTSIPGDHTCSNSIYYRNVAGPRHPTDGKVPLQDADACYSFKPEYPILKLCSDLSCTSCIDTKKGKGECAWYTSPLDANIRCVILA